MQKILSILSILLCVFSCSRDHSPLKYSNPGYSSIVGEWEWNKSIYSQTGGIITTDDVGYQEIKIFTIDGIYKIIRNDSLHKQFEYSVFYDDSTEIQSSGVLRLVNYANPSFSIENNTLILDLAPTDGPTSYHKRLK